MYPRIAQLKTVAAFRQRLRELGAELPCDERALSAAEGSPLAQPGRFGPRVVGNRWCIHPMEGWDGQPDGSPSDLTLRRWSRFGQSGAKLIWGGEAAAVRHDGRANARQIIASPAHRAGLAQLLATLHDAHEAACGSREGLLVGLQLTHSGRFARPNSRRLQPRLAYHHPWLDARDGVDPHDRSLLWSDEELSELIVDYVAAARTAQEVGYDFVDLKACHGYLVHELLAGHARPGRYGGDYAGRTRFLQELIVQVRQACPGLLIGVRLSMFDLAPFAAQETSEGAICGAPVSDLSHALPQPFGAGRDDRTSVDLTEPLRLIGDLQAWGVAAVNLTAGSPYYNPHIQRPALFPPSDGYPPPEDPLLGVVRQMTAARDCQRAYPDLPMVGTAFSYLQDFLPKVAQAVVRQGWMEYVGLGRMVLSYPELPADVFAGRALQRKRICRTLSDCTTGPRRGLISGCYPLDPFYKGRPEAQELKQG